MAKAAHSRKLPAQARSKLTVAAILEATAHILLERGYSKLSTNAVAERAGVSIGSLYQYFPNKESLICALYERHREKMRAEIGGKISPALKLDSFDDVYALVGAIAKAHLVEPELHSKFETLRFEEPFVELMRDNSLADIEQQLERLLQQSQKAYAIKDTALSARMLAVTVYTLVHTFAINAEEAKKASAEVARMLYGYIMNPTRN